MKKIFLSLYIVVFSIFITGCSYFGKGAVRSAAEVISMEKLKALLKSEVDATITSEHPRANDYVYFVLQNTKAEVDSLVELGDDKMQAKMKVHTIHPEARLMLLEIVGKLQGKKANAFNFSDALGMIKMQKGETVLFNDQQFSLALKKIDYRWVEL